MTSLRTRLLLLTGSIVAVALVSVALFSQRTVQTEYRRLTVESRRETASRAGDAVGSWLRGGGRLEDADSVLAGLRGEGPGDWVLLAPDGRIAASTLPPSESLHVALDPSGRVTIDDASGGSGRRATRMVLVGVPRIAVRDAAGRLRATLLALPPWPRAGEEAAREPRFLTSVNRGLFLAVIGSGLLALLVTLVLSRRILAPIEALTDAARRMQRGDLSARVTPRSRDEIGQLARAFNAMADALVETESLRRNLVGDVAHELRTPLTNLRCQIEAIQDGLAPADEKTVRSLHEETMLLGRLVDDLQDLALAEAGRLPLHPESVDVASAIDAAALAVRPRAAERRVAIRLEAAPGLAVRVDPARLGQILRNLLENALTHTPEGGSVSIAAIAQAGAVAISVADSGPGIAPEHLPRVFERFYRADPSRDRSTGGAGLGLAIVKHLAAAHGGDVRVSSEPGRGARFTVTLPAATS